MSLTIDQFSSVFTIPDPPNFFTDLVSFFTHEPNTGINKSLSLIDIMLNEDNIIEAIQELSSNSAAGSDCALSSLLVNCATELAPVLLLIFSYSLSHGVIPKSWKSAAIIPIYKSGDKTVPSNYRPISLTAVICSLRKNYQKTSIFLP